MIQEYTVQEVAAKLQVSERTIQREIKRGKLRSSKIGRKFVVSEADLDQYLHKSNASAEDTIHKFCVAQKGEIVNFLQRLVSTASESNHPADQEDFVKALYKQLQKLGFRVVMYGTGSSATVHATFGYAKDGLLLNCPIDTAPVGDLNKWSYPPFDGVIRNGRMFGRGTADCKSGIAAMIYAVLALREVVDESKVRIELVFDCGEQNGEFLGMKDTLERGLDVSAGIVGYTADPQELALGARGYHRYTFTVRGVPANTGSRYHVGVNAITKAASFALALEKVELPKSKQNLFWFGSKVTPSMIDGGSAISVVPETCALQVDVRTSPDVTRKVVDEVLSKTIKKLKQNDQEMIVDMSYLVGAEGYSILPKERVVSAAMLAVEETVNIKPRLVVRGPSNVGNLLSKHKIPVVVRGPLGDNINRYDEYVVLDSIPQAAEIYAKTVLHYFRLA